MNRRFTIMFAGLILGSLFFYTVQKNRNAGDPVEETPSETDQSSSVDARAPAAFSPEEEPAADALPEHGPVHPDSTEKTPSPSFHNIQFANSEETTHKPSPGSHNHVIKEWKGQFSPSIQSLAENLGSFNSDHPITLNLPNGESISIHLSGQIKYSETRGVLTGTIPGSPHSEVILSYVNQAVSGSIMTPETGEVIEIKNAGDGYQYIAQIDTEALGKCGVCAQGHSHE